MPAKHSHPLVRIVEEEIGQLEERILSGVLLRENPDTVEYTYAKIAFALTRLRSVREGMIERLTRSEIIDDEDDPEQA